MNDSQLRTFTYQGVIFTKPHDSTCMHTGASIIAAIEKQR
jgi:hypothetical protein